MPITITITYRRDCFWPCWPPIVRCPSTLRRWSSRPCRIYLLRGICPPWMYPRTSLRSKNIGCLCRQTFRCASCPRTICDRLPGTALPIRTEPRLWTHPRTNCRPTTRKYPDRYVFHPWTRPHTRCFPCLSRCRCLGLTSCRTWTRPRSSLPLRSIVNPDLRADRCGNRRRWFCGCFWRNTCRGREVGRFWSIRGRLFRCFRRILECWR